MERAEDVAREPLAREDELEREDEERELDERSAVECERVPRRVDSLELTVHPPRSSSTGRIHPTAIHQLPLHQRPLCPLLPQLLPQCLLGC